MRRPLTWQVMEFHRKGLGPGIPGRWGIQWKIIDSKCRVLVGNMVRFIGGYTLFETNMLHLKIGDWKMTSLLERLSWY